MPRSQSGSRRNPNTSNNNRTTTTTRQRQRKIHNVKPSDIICTQASRTFETHPGTLLYNTVIDNYASQYSTCRNSNEKKQLTQRIIDTLLNEHGSRFIEPVTCNNEDRMQSYYYKVPLYRVHGKVSHALRTRCKSIGESSGQQQQQQVANAVLPRTLTASRTLAIPTGRTTAIGPLNASDERPQTFTTSRTLAIPPGEATTAGPLFGSGFSFMPHARSQLLASSSRSFNNANNRNDYATTLPHAASLPDNNSNTNLSDIDDSSYTTHQFENDVRYIAVVRTSNRKYVSSPTTSYNIHRDRPDQISSNNSISNNSHQHLPSTGNDQRNHQSSSLYNLFRDRPDQIISNGNFNSHHHRPSRASDQRSHRSSSSLPLPFIKEEDEVAVFDDDRNNAARRNRFLYHRRENQKRHNNQRGNEQATTGERQDMDRQNVALRNRYYNHRHQKQKRVVTL